MMAKTTLTDGSPVTPDHREINPKTGMQKGYVVLSDDERVKGFVRPVRRSYRHLKCGVVTTMENARVDAAMDEADRNPDKTVFELEDLIAEHESAAVR